MKARRRTDLLGVALQLGAAGKLSVFELLELLDRGEMAVDQDRVGQRPQSPGGAPPAAIPGNTGGRKSNWTWSGTRR